MTRPDFHIPARNPQSTPALPRPKGFLPMGAYLCGSIEYSPDQGKRERAAAGKVATNG